MFQSLNPMPIIRALHPRRIMNAMCRCCRCIRRCMRRCWAFVRRQPYVEDKDPGTWYYFHVTGNNNIKKMIHERTNGYLQFYCPVWCKVACVLLQTNFTIIVFTITEVHAEASDVVKLDPVSAMILEKYRNLPPMRLANLDVNLTWNTVYMTLFTASLNGLCWFCSLFFSHFGSSVIQKSSVDLDSCSNKG